MTRYLALHLTGLVVLIGTGIAHGVWTNRWRSLAELDAAETRLARLPLTVGDWDGRELEIDPSIFPRELYGVGIARRYVNRTDGNVVTVYLGCGRPGPMAVHSPVLCYDGNGLAMVSGQERCSASGADFWHARFSGTSRALPRHYRVFWSWNGGSGWLAPEYPRWTLARYHPVVYKLYVISSLARGDESLETDPSLPFLQQLLPEVEKVLQAS
jgi:hypothetical protein